MTSVPWDAQGEAQAALRTIVADPRYGPAALSNAQTMTNLLKDMLPDSPRESSVLVAASEAGVAGLLQSSLSRGIDVATASRLAAGSLESRTALTPDACSWAVGVLASALRLDAVRSAPSQPRRQPRHRVYFVRAHLPFKREYPGYAAHSVVAVAGKAMWKCIVADGSKTAITTCPSTL